MIRAIIFLVFIILSSFSSNTLEGSHHKPKVLDSPIVINLYRHPQRFEQTKRLMKRAGFQNIRRFEAIDGFYTDQSFFDAWNILGGSPGQRGCAASHLRIWYDFFTGSNSKEFLFVCEDDMLPHSDFERIFPLYWKKTPKDFDIVMVGNQYDDREYTKKLIVQHPSFCLHAYIISKKGAEKLYNLYMQLPFGSGDLHVIDIFLIEEMKKNSINYYCYNGSVYPDCVNQKNKCIFNGRSTGICFQNMKLGTSIKSINIQEN